jgi:hypothetical protein
MCRLLLYLVACIGLRFLSVAGIPNAIRWIFHPISLFHHLAAVWFRRLIGVGETVCIEIEKNYPPKFRAENVA